MDGLYIKGVVEDWVPRRMKKVGHVAVVYLERDWPVLKLKKSKQL